MDSAVRIARGSKTATQLATLGVHPRVAKAVGAMVAVNLDGVDTLTEPLLKDALNKAASGPVMDLLLKEAAEAAPSILCGDLGKRWVKANKLSGGGGSGGASSTVRTISTGGGGGNFAGGNCFLGSTPIFTPQGERAIEDLNAGDKVTAFDPNTGELSERSLVAVTGPLDNKKHLHLQVGGADIFCTAGHPFLTPAGFVKAGELEAGSSVVLADRTHQQIGSISTVQSEAPVYNLQVEGVQTFIAQGAVVHNTTIVDVGGVRRAVKMTKDYEDEDEEAAVEEMLRQEERDIAEQTVKLGYSVARHMGFDSATAMFAGIYAFTKL